MRKLQLVSDLHLDHDPDGGVEFLKSTFDQDYPDTILVVAGDWSSSFDVTLTKRFFDAVCPKYLQVFAVCGNHEFWGVNVTDRHALGKAMQRLEQLGAEYENLRLTTTFKEVYARWDVEDLGMIGGTMWYPYPPPPPIPSKFPDLRFMGPGFPTEATGKWIDEQHSKFMKSLGALATNETVVVTHHMPSTLSSAPRFKNDAYNWYFVTEGIEKFITERQPALWLHGHGHHPADYMMGNTRVVCNPRGYPGEVLGPYAPVKLEVAGEWHPTGERSGW